MKEILIVVFWCFVGPWLAVFGILLFILLSVANNEAIGNYFDEQYDS